MPRKQYDKIAVLKMSVLAAFIISAVCIIRFTPVKNFLATEGLRHK